MTAYISYWKERLHNLCVLHISVPVVVGVPMVNNSVCDQSLKFNYYRDLYTWVFDSVVRLHIFLFGLEDILVQRKPIILFSLAVSTKNSHTSAVMH